MAFMGLVEAGKLQVGDFIKIAFNGPVLRVSAVRNWGQDVVTVTTERGTNAFPTHMKLMKFNGAAG